jgi:fibronectin-binding autotransporter adhesin
MLAAAAASVVSAFGDPAHASIRTWSGTTSSAWGTGTNWTALPVSGDSVVFTSATGAGGLNLNDNLTSSSFSIAGITYNSGAAAFVIGDGTAGDANAGNTFILTGNVANSGTSLETINDPFSMTAARTFTLSTSGGNITLGGNISGAGGAITTAGTGTLVVSGANSFTGGTTLVSGVVLDVNSATALGTGTLTVTAGTLDNTSGAAITDIQDNAVTANGNFAFTGTNSLNIGDGAFNLGSTSGSRTITVNGGNFTIGGIVVNGTATSLTKAGSGALTLSNYNTFTGGVTLNAGTLNINQANALGTTAGTFTVAGGTIDNTSGFAITTAAYPLALNASFAFTGTNSLNLGAGAVTLGANDTITVNADTLTIGGIIASTANSLTKVGNGTLSLGGVNLYTGGTNINAGILNITNASALGSSGTISFGGGTLQYGGITTDLSARFSTAASQPISIDTNNNAVTFATALISSGGSLSKTGLNTLTLTANNTFTGATLINGGSLAVNGAAGQLSGTTAVTVTGATLNDGDSTAGNGIANRINSAATLTLGGASGGGVLTTFKGSTTVDTQSFASLTVGTGSSTTSLSGSSGTAPTLTFSGAAGSVYTRNQGGIVNFSSQLPTFTNAPSGSSVSGGTAPILIGAILNGTSFVNDAAGVAAAETTTVGTWASGNNTIAASGTQTTALTQSLTISSASVTITLSGANQISSGGLLVTSAGTSAAISGSGTLTAGSSQDLWIFGNAGLTIGASIIDNGTTGLTTAGGVTDTLTGANTYSGVTTIGNANTLAIGAVSGTTGTLGTGNGNVQNFGTLQFNRTDTGYTAANNISGTGTITQAGSGTTTLSGNVTGTQAVNVSTGSLVLSGNNSFSGATTVANAATLQLLTSSTALGSSALTLNNGSTLQLRANSSTSFGSGAITLPTLTGNNQNYAVTFDVGNATTGSNQTLSLPGSATTGLSGGGTNDSMQLNVVSSNSSTGYTLALGQIYDNTVGGGGGNSLNVIFNPTTANLSIAGILGSGASSLNNYTFQGSGNTTVGPINDNTTNNNRNSLYTFNSSGSGQVTLSGANTFTSGSGAPDSFTISGGTVNFNNASVWGISGQSLTVAINGGTIDNTSGAALTVNNQKGWTFGGDFAFTGTNNLNLGTGTVTLGGTGTARTLTTNGGDLTTGAFSSTALGLTKAGTGVLTQSGASNIGGTLTVSAGKLQTNSSNFTATGLSGGGTIENGGGTANTLFINNASGNNTSFSGILQDGSGGGTMALAKGGAGTLTLNGATASTNSGLTSSNAGSLVLDLSNLGTPTNLLASTDAVTLGGGNLTIKGTSGITAAQTVGNFTLTAATASSITLNANTGTAANLTESGTFTRNTGSTVLLDVSNAGAGSFTASGLTASTVYGYTVVTDGTGTGIGKTNASKQLVRLTGQTVLTASNSTSGTGTTDFSTTPTDLAYSGGVLTLTNATNATDSLAIASGAGGTLDLGGNTMTFANGALLMTGTGNYTIQDGTLGGATETILHQYGSGTLTVTTTIGSGAGSLTVDGTGTVQIGAGGTVGSIGGSGALTDDGTLIFNRSNALTVSNAISGFATASMTQAGAGALTLTGANSGFLGTFNINANTTVQAGNTSALGTGTLVLNSGSKLSSNSTTAYSLGSTAVTINGNTTLGDATNTGTLTIGGPVSLGSTTPTITVPAGVQILSGLIGSTGAGLTKSGAGELESTAAGNNTYAGPTTVNGGTLYFNYQSNGTSVGASNSDFTLNSGTSLLAMMYVQSITGTVGKSLTMNGAYYQLGTTDSTASSNGRANTYAFTNALTLNSGSNTLSIDQTQNGGDGSDMLFGSLARTAGATVLFRGSLLGSGTLLTNDNTAGIVFTASPSAQLVGGGGAIGTTTTSILPYAIGDAGYWVNSVYNTPGLGTDFVTYGQSSTSIQLLTTYATSIANSTASTNNAKITDAAASFTGSSSINSLILNSATAASSSPGTSSVDGTGTLTVTSGALMVTTTTSPANSGINGGVGVGNYGGLFTNNATIGTSGLTLAFGSAEGIITTVGPSTLTIASASGGITGTGGITKSGAGTLTLSDAANAYSGATTINAGTLALSTSASTNNISSSRTINVLSGATLDVSGVTASGHFTLNGTGTQSTSQALGGTGTLKGDITIANRATISAGTSTALGVGTINTFGTLTTTSGTTTFGTGGVYAWKDSAAPANGAAGTDWDTLTLNALNVTASNASPFVVSLSSFNGQGGTLGGTPTGLANTGAQYSWTIAHTNTTAQINGVNVTSGAPLTSGLSSDVFVLDTSTLGNFEVGGSNASASLFALDFVTSGSGDNLVLTYNSAPEPATAMLVLAGAVPMLMGRRRRVVR